MSVFDFNAEAKEERKNAKCTFTLFRSNETTATPEHPILVLDNREKQWEHHSKGVFTNPVRETAFEFEDEDGRTHSADILKIDARFVKLLKWLGENKINVRLSGSNEADRICSVQDQGDRLWRRNKAFCGRWLLTVYDRTSSGEQCPAEGSVGGRGSGRWR